MTPTGHHIISVTGLPNDPMKFLT